jgi:hypothetical protein
MDNLTKSQNPQNNNLQQEESGSDTKISHSPLNLGGPDISQVKEKKPAASPTRKNTPAAAPAATSVNTGGEKITGVKTFFTKLHSGAIDYLDEQINDWLKNNPDLNIKMTNSVTGEVQGKKTEPNIIITIWY